MSELMPYLDGITGYFDVSSVDLANNKWVNIAETNLVDKHDISLTGGVIQNNALYLTNTQYGKLEMSTEAQTIYCVFKALSLQSGWMPIITKQMSSNSSNQYNYSIHLDPSGYVTGSACGSDVISTILGTDYHVACVTKINSKMYLYVDGVMIGSATAYEGLYSGYFYLNKLMRGTYSGDPPTDVEYRMCAFGTMYHDEDAVKMNTAFLMNGIKPKNSRLAGTDAVAIAYAIARNQENAAALQEMKKAYREGVKRGNDGIPDDNEPVEEIIDDNGNTPIEPIVDPNNPDDVDKRGADVYYTIQSGSGETATTYYLRIYTTDETGERGNDTGMYTYAWTYTLVYDLYDSNGKSVIDKQPISTRYSAGVAPLNAWYFKPSYVNYRYEDTSYNIYMYVEKVECSGQYITVHFVTVHAKTGEVYHGRNTTTVGVPEGATVVHTNSQKPF